MEVCNLKNKYISSQKNYLYAQLHNQCNLVLIKSNRKERQTGTKSICNAKLCLKLNRCVASFKESFLLLQYYFHWICQCKSLTIDYRYVYCIYAVLLLKLLLPCIQCICQINKNENSAELADVILWGSTFMFEIRLPRKTTR